jgi:uncharacterized membrane protein YeaQ/YmgE (transglycosylase-associated protein family)
MLLVGAFVVGFVLLGLRAHDFDARTRRGLLAFVGAVVVCDLVRMLVAD